MASPSEAITEPTVSPSGQSVEDSQATQQNSTQHTGTLLVTIPVQPDSPGNDSQRAASSVELMTAQVDIFQVGRKEVVEEVCGPHQLSGQGFCDQPKEELGINDQQMVAPSLNNQQLVALSLNNQQVAAENLCDPTVDAHSPNDQKVAAQGLIDHQMSVAGVSCSPCVVMPVISSANEPKTWVVGDGLCGQSSASSTSIQHFIPSPPVVDQKVLGQQGSKISSIQKMAAPEGACESMSGLGVENASMKLPTISPQPVVIAPYSPEMMTSLTPQTVMTPSIQPITHIPGTTSVPTKTIYQQPHNETQPNIEDSKVSATLNYDTHQYNGSSQQTSEPQMEQSYSGHQMAPQSYNYQQGAAQASYYKTYQGAAQSYYTSSLSCSEYINSSGQLKSKTYVADQTTGRRYPVQALPKQLYTQQQNSTGAVYPRHNQALVANMPYTFYNMAAPVMHDVPLRVRIQMLQIHLQMLLGKSRLKAHCLYRIYKQHSSRIEQLRYQSLNDMSSTTWHHPSINTYYDHIHLNLIGQIEHSINKVGEKEAELREKLRLQSHGDDDYEQISEPPSPDAVAQRATVNSVVIAESSPNMDPVTVAESLLNIDSVVMAESLPNMGSVVMADSSPNTDTVSVANTNPTETGTFTHNAPVMKVVGEPLTGFIGQPAVLAVQPISYSANNKPIYTTKNHSHHNTTAYTLSSEKQTPALHMAIKKNKEQLAAVRLAHIKKSVPLNVVAVRIMNKWYEQNIDAPYPANETAEVMANAGGITVEQVKKWFANKRMRSGNTKSIKEQAKSRSKQVVHVHNDVLFVTTNGQQMMQL